MHQIRSVSLYSYLDVAAFLEIDGLKLLAEAGISPTDLDRPDGRLPAGAAVSLLERSAEVSGFDSFGVRMAECRAYSSLGPLSLLLERLGNVAEVLETMDILRRSLSDVLIVSTQIKDGLVSATFDVITPFGGSQALDLTLALGYLALSGASHGRWVPEAVHFTHSSPKDREPFERFFQVPLIFESSFNGFSFREEALRIALPLADAAMAENVRKLLRNAGLPSALAPLSDHAKHSIQLLLPTGRATLPNVARNLGKTGRVLQRQLVSEGFTFGGLLTEVKRNLAQSYLLRSSQNLTSIAAVLGYANPGSFTRWFEREFGEAPSHWRKTRLLDALPAGAATGSPVSTEVH